MPLPNRFCSCAVMDVDRSLLRFEFRMMSRYVPVTRDAVAPPVAGSVSYTHLTLPTIYSV